MRNSALLSTLLVVMMSASSCAAIGGIFKAGVWTGVIIVVAVIGLIIFFISRGSGKK